jgi:hypothetical protein
MEEAYAVAGGVGRRHRPCGAIVEVRWPSLPDGLEEMGATSVWKRRGQSSEQRGATDLK